MLTTVPSSPPAVDHFDSAAPTRRNPVFALGLYPQRDRLPKPVPYTGADLDFVKGHCPSDAMTEAESYGWFLDSTLSPIQFNALMEELAELARHSDANERGIAF